MKPLRRAAGQSERAALQQLCAQMAGTPLDARHPLWHFQLVPTYEGGSALVVRIHEAYGTIEEDEIHARDAEDAP